MVSLMLQPIYPKEQTPQHSLSKRLGALQSWFGCSGEDKNLLVPATNQTMIPQAFNALPGTGLSNMQPAELYDVVHSHFQ